MAPLSTCPPFWKSCGSRIFLESRPHRATSAWVAVYYRHQTPWARSLPCPGRPPGACPHLRDEGRPRAPRPAGPGIFSEVWPAWEKPLWGAGWGAGRGERVCLAPQPPPWGQQEACGSLCLRRPSPGPGEPPAVLGRGRSSAVVHACVCVCSMHVCACSMNQAGECVGGHGLGRRGSLPG